MRATRVKDNLALSYFFFSPATLLWHRQSHSRCIKIGGDSKDIHIIMHIYNRGQKSLGQYCNIHIFLSFLGSLIKQRILFMQFSLPPPYTNVKLRKNSGYMSSTLFVGWGEEMDPCWKTPQKCKSAPRLLSMIVWKRGG